MIRTETQPRGLLAVSLGRSIHIEFRMISGGQICATFQSDKLHDEFKGDHIVKGWVYQRIGYLPASFPVKPDRSACARSVKEPANAQVHFKEKRTGVGATNPGRIFL